MNFRTSSINGFFYYKHLCRRQSPRLVSLNCSKRSILAVEARRSLISTPFPQDQQKSTSNKDAASTSTSSSLLKVCNLAAPHTGHIRVITLNSPRNKNAISRQLLAELEAELQSCHDETTKEDNAWQSKKPGATLGQGTRAIIIGSEVDGVFCAGADLKERAEMTRQEYGFRDPSDHPNTMSMADRGSKLSLTQDLGPTTSSHDSAAPSP